MAAFSLRKQAGKPHASASPPACHTLHGPQPNSKRLRVPMATASIVGLAWLGLMGCQENKSGAPSTAGTPTAASSSTAPTKTAAIPLAHLRLRYTKSAPMPTPRNAFALVSTRQGDLLAIGGQGANGAPSAAVSLFEARANRWRSAAPMPTPRHHFGYSQLGPDRWVVVGGITTKNTRSAAAAIYHAVDDRWEALPPLPLGRARPAVVVGATGDILVFGGRSAEKGCSNNCDHFDRKEGRWLACNPLPLATCSAAALLVPGGVYLFGGRNDQDLPVPAVRLAFGSKQWTSARGPHQPRDSHAFNQLQNGHWLLSGGDRGPMRLKSMEVFDPQTSRWSKRVKLPAARAVHSATTLRDGRVLLAGGNAEGRFAIQDVSIFDPQSNSIQAATALPAGRSGHRCGALPDGSALLLAGFNSKAMPAQTNWRIEPQPGPTP